MAAGIIVRSDWPIFMTTRGTDMLRKKSWEGAANLLPQQKDELYNVESTTDAYYQSMGTVGLGRVYRKPETTPKRLDAPMMGRPFTMVFPTYALAVAISREAQEDDKKNELVPMITRELRLAMIESMEEDAFAQLLDGFDYQGWESDGQPLFSNVHPLLRNQRGGANPGVSSNRHPTDAALSITSLDTAFTTMRTQKNDTGRWINPIKPATLWVAPQLYPYAMQIVNTQRALGSNNNDTNNYYKAFDVKMTPRLADKPQQWYLDSGMNSFLWRNRRMPDFETDVDKVADVTVLMTSARWGRGAEDWRGIYGSRGPA